MMVSRMIDTKSIRETSRRSRKLLPRNIGLTECLPDTLSRRQFHFFRCTIVLFLWIFQFSTGGLDSWQEYIIRSAIRFVIAHSFGAALFFPRLISPKSHTVSIIKRQHGMSVRLHHSPIIEHQFSAFLWRYQLLRSCIVMAQYPINITSPPRTSNLSLKATHSIKMKHICFARCRSDYPTISGYVREFVVFLCTNVTGACKCLHSYNTRTRHASLRLKQYRVAVSNTKVWGCF